MMPTLKHFRLDTTLDDRITIWIDVAERSVNVLFEEVFDELTWIMEYLPQLGSALPVLFRSAKQKGFVVGADLRRILTIESDSENQAFLLHGQTALRQLEEYPGTTIAVIQGPCLGGGLELAMACDYRLASDTPNTQLGMPETKLGLMPGWGGTQRLTEWVGLETSLSMLLSGESIDSQRAFEIHLVDALLHAEALEAELALAIHKLTRPRKSDSPDDGLTNATRARFIAWQTSHSLDLSPSQSAICEAVERGILHSRDAGFQAERELFFSLLSSPSVRETLQRFAGGSEKRTGG